MAEATLEERVATLEQLVAQLMHTAERTARKKDWRRTIGMFDGFRLDSRGGGLLRNDGSNWLPVAMGSRALAVLDVLAERHGELVPKQQIMDAVWPDTAVEDNNLTVQISALLGVHQQSWGSSMRRSCGAQVGA